MSLILDALKKLDREKSFRREGTVDIAAEILRPDLPRRSKKVFVYALGVLFTALVAAALTYLVMPKSPPPAAKTPMASEPKIAPAPVSDPQKGGARDEIARRSVPSQPSVQRKVPVETRRPVESKKPVEVKAPPAEPKSPAPLPTETKTGPEVMSKEPPPPTEEIRKPAEQPPPPKKSPLTPASLRLTGIVWSEDPSKRLAVINGLVTTEGYVFEGAKVVEIHPDHVVLLLNDEPLKLSLNR